MRRYVASCVRSATLAVLFAALLLACGLATRPIALALPQLHAFHAVLMALPAASLIMCSLRRDGSYGVCAGAVCGYAAVLSFTNPLMGASVLAPLPIAGAIWLARGSSSLEARARSAGWAYGALGYPCTLLVTVISDGVLLAFDGAVLLEVAVSTCLGVALGGLGVALASNVPKMEGER